MNRNRVLPVVLSAAMALTPCASAFAAETQTEPAATEASESVSQLQAHYDAAVNVAEEGIVLMENNGVLPMAAQGNVALYGDGAFSTATNSMGDITVGDKTYRANIADAFADAGYNVLTSADSTVGEPLSEQPDYVLYVLARTSAEASDRTATEGDYYLDDQELIDLTSLAATYKNVILVLNACGVTDFHTAYESITAAVPDGIGAVVFTGIGGDGSGNAVVNVLNNTVPVSGKLADTWAANYEDYPSSDTFGTVGHTEFDLDDTPEYYIEGIFTGYRYFDTFNIEPAYHFGYGLSYTDFSITDPEVSLSDTQDTVTVTATVTNTGDTYSGKETVQVYFSYDYNDSEDAYLETAYQELAGYAKTDLLAPGESQTVTIDFPTTDMASYDESTDQYVLQGGDYLIRVGSASNQTDVAAVLSLDENVVTKQCTEGLFELDDEDAQTLEEKSLHYDDILPTEAETEAVEDETQADPSGAQPSPDAQGGPGADMMGGMAQEQIRPELDYKTFDVSSAQTISLDPDAVSALFEDETSPYSEDSVETYVSTDENTDSYAYANSDHTSADGRSEEYVSVDTADGYTLVDVYDGTITMQQLVASMSREELADIVTGLSSEQTDELYDENSPLLQYISSDLSGYQGTKNLLTWRFIPQVFQSDGPEGCGVDLSFLDIWTEGATESENASYQSVRLPSETLMAQTWNDDLVKTLGAAVGKEMADAGLSIWLAPCADLHRNPLGGRNMQYYSEDTLLSGKMLSAETAGVQSNDGVFACIKHVAVNNMETNRGSVNCVISERALRENYLKVWEIETHSDSPAGAIMTAYNQINGQYCGESYDLCTQIIRGEWGYEGLIMDDYTPWFFMIWRNLASSVKAGNDLVMPGNTTSDVTTGPMAAYENPYADAQYEDVTAPFQSDSYVMLIALDQGDLLLGDLQKAAAHILNVYMQTDIFHQIYDAVKTYNIAPSRS